MDNVIWKPVVGYEGLYEVSNTGLVRSLNKLKGRILTPIKRKNGYLNICLYKNCKQVTKLVHRMVAEAFIPNPDNLEMVNHKDEDRTNNHVDNLEWCTRAYNQVYSMNLHPERRNINADNLRKHSTRNKKGVPHKHYKQVAILDDNNNIINIYDNASTAAKILGLHTCNVTEVCKANQNRQIEKRRKTGGHIFMFIEE